MKSRRETFGLRLFAVLLGLSAFGHFAWIRPAGGTLMLVVTLAAGVAALISSVSLWRQERKAIAAFGVWVVLVLIRLAIDESLVQGVPPIEVGLACIMMALFWVPCFLYVRFQLQLER